MLINAADTDITAGDVMIACDFDHSAVFQVSSYDDAAVQLTHDVGVVGPGNTASDLGLSSGIREFPRNSLLGRFLATDWYIGQSGNADEGGRSLFRRRVAPGGQEIAEEVVAGVTDMQILYRVGDAADFVASTAVVTTADWENVNAVRVDLAVESADTRVSADSDVATGRIQREFSQIITLRNRVP